MNPVLLSVLFAFAATAVCCPLLIWGLKSLKLTQPILSELPSDHQAKRGTPLMAGLILFCGIAAPFLVHTSPLTGYLGAVFLLFSLIGFLDDMKKALFQNPSGISARTKLLFQFLFTAVLLYVLYSYFELSTNIPVTATMELVLPVFLYFSIAALFIVGSANAINFTDGMDGLLIVVSLPTYLFFFAISEQPEVQLFCLTMIASLIGLLFYNLYPAKAFMGDTGSLAIGGSLAFLCVMEKVEILAPLLFFVYFAEQLSVILQVWYYKKTKLRIFKMAPIHYHFRLKYGWSENTIVLVFGSVSWACALLCYMLWRYVLVT
ncbi:Phospho-N-acetylmuramoyl-pentapeptide-transferase [Paenibacillus allorhizosphaerae]|uniref:Phospho-N-acetylmuramoyl-pentapeptide-transferase n=1 Tax=Paenibacillus allorhizosphaerae TaxID=2849866 RepID=A0ABN7THR4_9BACL|nr:phospho-N-acetylmuramoyl-pentapeptide-transferase [Paenibacillus allorhizosphaerae]CAG7629374.1 Phospho-N-acetylmuramoyl-pentapeptide-transferase [Paenibacillus allorhizosphaerae]